MEKFNYKSIAKEIGWNFSKVNYLVENKSGYNYYQEVIKHLKSNSVVLDIGCGSAEKSAKFYNLAKKIYLTDIEIEMLKKARDNVKKYYGEKFKSSKKFLFKIMNGNEAFGFKDNSFDIVVSRHCGANMKEVYRVLKNGGIFISEDYSSDDCQELKDIFNRGQNYNETPLYKKVMLENLDSGFSKIELLNFQEIEYYKTKEDLVYLLKHTPILNYYNEEKDDKVLEIYIQKFKTKKGIKLNRKLYSFKLMK